MTLPDGYAPVEVGGARGFARPEVEAWVRATLSRGPLHREAAAAAVDTLQGRGPVPVVAVAGRLRVVRHYFRGGAVAAVLHDRYLRLGDPRPLRELRASDVARRRGVPTPRVVAGAVYPSGPFYRADLVTDYVADGRELAAVVFGRASPGERRAALRATGSLVARMAAAGLRHPDLNARNVLLTPRDDRFEALLLDLDRCSVAPPGRAAPLEPLLARLRRSLETIPSRAGGEPLPGAELAVLEGSARGEAERP